MIGGVHTLLLRLSKSLMERGNSVCVFCFGMEDGLEYQYQSQGVKIVKSNIKSISKDINNLDSAIDAVIAFEFDLFLKLFISSKKTKFAKKIFLYSVHPYTIDYYLFGVDLRKKTYHKLFEKSISEFISSKINNGFIFFMDEQSLQHTIDEFNVHISSTDYSNHILRIIMNENFFAANENIYRNTDVKSLNFLTVSRADFPFKGYMKKLVDVFSELNVEKKHHLTIISSGPNIDELKNWILECPDKDSITLVTDVSYDDLSKYYCDSDIYIGMGTTVLEAANCGVVSIPVEPYTYDCKTHGLFIDNPRWVLTELNKGYDIRILLASLLNKSSDELSEIKKNGIKAVDELYSADTVIKKMSNILTDADGKDYYRNFPTIYYFLRKVREFVNL